MWNIVWGGIEIEAFVLRGLNTVQIPSFVYFDCLEHKHSISACCPPVIKRAWMTFWLFVSYTRSFVMGEPHVLNKPVLQAVDYIHYYTDLSLVTFVSPCTDVWCQCVIIIWRGRRNHLVIGCYPQEVTSPNLLKWFNKWKRQWMMTALHMCQVYDKGLSSGVIIYISWQTMKADENSDRCQGAK